MILTDIRFKQLLFSKIYKYLHIVYNTKDTNRRFKNKSNDLYENEQS